jgi:regulator of protease activity HflC (stomatin/prohibitin superfamily)
MNEATIVNLLGSLFSFWTLLGLFIIILVWKSIHQVPQGYALIVERFGKYRTTLNPGLNFIIPVMDRIADRRLLKEQAANVPSQTAITSDNITLRIDGVLYFKVIDPERATYGVDDYIFALSNLAQTTMRAAIGKMELDKTFEERDAINANIVEAINNAAEPWGVVALRYEIRDIDPPESVMNAMEQQMKAEREKRATVLESEGFKAAEINKAEGEKQAAILAAEADRQEQVLRAQGEASAILAVAEAKAQGIRLVGEAASTAEGQKAVQYELAVSAIAAKHAIAKEGTVVLMDGTKSDAGSTVAEAVGIVSAMNKSEAFQTT